MVLQRSCVTAVLIISCLGLVARPACGLARLEESAIEKHKAFLSMSFEKNAQLRTIIKNVGMCAGVAVAIGSAYYLFKHDEVVQVVPQLPTEPSLEQVAKLINYHDKRIAGIEQHIIGPQFGSLAWVKATAGHFFLSPVFFFTILEQLGVWGFNKLNDIFYPQTLAWYIQTHTQLGVLRDQVSEEGQLEKHLLPGPLSLELMHHITLVDDPSKSPIPVDIEFHKKCIIDNVKSLVDDMAGIIAFMQYKAEFWNTMQVPKMQDSMLRSIIIKHNKTRSIQVQDIVRYIFNFTNDTCAALEKELALEQNSADAKRKLLALMKGFFVELESELIRFKLIEQERLA
jgi:hypothetical protein